jgi:mRNA interferase MazF
VVASSYQPDRGDLVWLSFTPQAGHEQAGRRPALVLSPRAFNMRTSLAFVCPITSRIKGRPFEVPLPPGGAVDGVVLVEQMRSVDWVDRKASFIAPVPDGVVTDVLARLEAVLGFAS